MEETGAEPILGMARRRAQALEVDIKEGAISSLRKGRNPKTMFEPLSRLLPSHYKKRIAQGVPQPPTPREIVAGSLRCEVNGLVYPFFFLTKGKGMESIETRVVRREGDRTFEAVWRVTPHPACGRPGPLAHRVHRAVEQLITERGLPVENPIPFSIHNLCHRIGMKAGGTEYRKVREALVAIRGTQVESKGMFYAKNLARYVDQVFSLYERIIFTGERLPDGTRAERNLLYLGTWYMESLNSLYVKPLDYRYYLKLHTPIARRLYELLGVKFYRVAEHPYPVIRYRYSTLCRLLPVKRHLYLSRMQQQLGPAHEELLRGGFLNAADDTPVPFQSDWYVSYRPGPKALAEIEANKRKTKKQRESDGYGAYSSGLRGGRHDAG